MSNEHNNAPAVPQGLERYEPTVMVEESRGRLTATGAVMKPKEDGRWVRLRDLTATPAPAPAQEVTTPYHRDIWGISHAMADLYYDEWVLLVRAYQTLDASIARMKEQATAQAVPQGWRITKLDGADAYVINGPFGGCVAVKDADIARVIPEAILYELAAALAATPAPVPAQDEPLGHFRVEPFGWTDCAKDDEGAIALYERPQEVGLTDEALDNLIEDLSEWSRHVVEDTAHQTLEAHVREVLEKNPIIAALRAKGQS